MTNIFNKYGYDEKYYTNTSNYNRVDGLFPKEKEKLNRLIQSVCYLEKKRDRLQGAMCEVHYSPYFTSYDVNMYKNQFDEAEYEYQCAYNAAVQYIKELTERFIFNAADDHYESGKVIEELKLIARHAYIAGDKKSYSLILKIASDANTGLHYDPCTVV